ncbi:cytochrome P450 [Aspergillus clavatus NRRL 1]|uniref:Cytochrome P450 oxidoreductase, putative n=1 Tax=Aspergillus clavatus (strain ATCC 1007 / CBS 513.65 / DSM 816 / NCTC 3887 / NRRL 1 / QM 1276 / 107) TaxID=344612 RepID=A1CCU1_ASPCL|nr:Cytochrome P450 oxidoreductase, putative [Aspergillus clavatus NRRL 1]EAW12348.1 Cytochrome P450 oxidoreductase, putative [Aspergillus clavatus NRRL 1]
MLFAVLLCLLAALLTFIVSCRSSQSREKPLPPGPSKLPVIGNVHQVPRLQFWKTMADFVDRYGPIVSVKLGQQQLIVLGNQTIARSLLDRKNTKYNSRPHLRVAERAWLGPMVALMPYGPEWRTYHLMQTAVLSSRAVRLYDKIYSTETTQLLHDLLSTNDYPPRIYRYSSGLAYAVAYGMRMPRGDEFEISEINEIALKFFLAAQPGYWSVDDFPFLRYLPGFLTPWKSYAAHVNQIISDGFQRAYSNALQRDSWSWARVLAEQETLRALPKGSISFVVGELWAAAHFSSSNMLVALIRLILYHPEEVQRAQEELDSTVGVQRLPQLADLDNMPYVRAFIREALRWLPSSGTPHASTEDDEFMGYRIPRGSMVVPHYWFVDMDSDVYMNPLKFRPERFVNDPKLPLRTFGFGSRICTGQYFAQNSFSMVIMRLLWAYNIRFPDYVDTEAEPIGQLEARIFTMNEKPTEAVFTPRSGAHRELIEQAYASLDSVDDALKPLQSIKVNIPKSF